MKILRVLLAFVAAVLVTHLLTSTAGTQIVLADVSGFGLDVTIADRVRATLHDIVGLVPILPIIIAVTLLIAFIVAALGVRFIGGKRLYWYLAAGFTSMPVSMIVLKVLLGVSGYAPAATNLGLFMMGLCGIGGGYLFARMTAPGAV